MWSDIVAWRAWATRHLRRVARMWTVARAMVWLRVHEVSAS